MRVLLDTHVLMWWVDQPSKIRSAWLEPILDPSNEIFVSAVSALEIETKKRGGKLQFDHEITSVVAEFGFEQLSLTMDISARAGRLDWAHADPFDRVLVAQAIAGDLVLLSADEVVRSAPGVRVL